MNLGCQFLCISKDVWSRKILEYCPGMVDKLIDTVIADDPLV